MVENLFITYRLSPSPEGYWVQYAQAKLNSVVKDKNVYDPLKI